MFNLDYGGSITLSSWYWRKISAIKDQLNLVLSEEQLLNMEVYSIKNVYKLLYGNVERVGWDKVVCNRVAIPKHKFFMWLTMKHIM